MPQLIWLYLTALLYYRTSVSCVALAEAIETVSHDRLTRLLRGNWSGQTLLDLYSCVICTLSSSCIAYILVPCRARFYESACIASV